MTTPRLADHRPELSPGDLVEAMTPPPRFDSVRFETYVPNPEEPSQAEAVDSCRAFAERVNAAAAGSGSRWWSLFGGKRKTAVGDEKLGLYLDGGFGVGKTHLLASIWHAVRGPKSYGTFVELTNLVGALGFAETVDRLSTQTLLAIDEFELDDPGDTMLVTQLIAKLTDAGVHVAATSNTLPDKLGEGRFAAVDFLREIHAMSARFGVVRVDGPDYRHRGLPDPPEPMSEADLLAAAEETPGATLDELDDLCDFLAGMHPSRYGALVDDVRAVHVRNVGPVSGQDVALRLVALVDRLYDRAVPVRVSGERLSTLFPEDMLQGGYRKKYLRALSRLTALSRDLAKS
ncbi:cell division protein ZapE [Allosaccharopolyspora coralli]|uniref:Cell division protein ZapE n=1 Tax=Allosaccharopolyspora coralli TaxID=2665642 RepID=A0A5Q3Q4Z9_9PSEU|nr:cell division protein ZapE [Allosaccharopolyspora coralli]QGK69532.1 cell division protein ZapE [Allosaccharopolyspora coralli]